MFRRDPVISPRAVVFAVAGFAFLAISASYAASGSWNSDTSGNWSDTTKWLGGTIADGAGSTGNFTFNITTAGPRTITIDGAVASRTLGILNIGDTDASTSYRIAASGGGTLTFDNGGSNAQLNQTSTSAGDTISAPVLLNSSLDIANASASNTLTISGGMTAGTAGTKTITTSTGLVAISSVIGDGSGVMAVSQSGPGTLTLTGANTYSGGTTLNGGVLQLGNAGNGSVSGPVGTGTLTLNGGTLSSNFTTARSIVNAITFGGNVTLGDATNTGALTFSGPGTLTGNRTLTLNSAITYSGIIGQSGGSFGITKAGAGSLTLSGGSSNTYSGKTTVSNGTLILNKNNTLNAISSTGSTGADAANTDLQILSGGTTQLNGSDQIINSAKVGLSGGTLILNGVSEGSISTAGVGSLTLSANSIIDLAGTSLLHFSPSNGQNWTGTLSIWNWTGTPVTGGGAERLLFGTSNTALTTAQLSEFRFYSDAGMTPFSPGGVILSSGEVVPVPEPSTWAAGLLSAAALGYTQRKRLAKRLRAIS